MEEHGQWRQGQIEVLHLLGRRKEERAALERLEAGLGQEKEEQQIDNSLSFVAAHLWAQSASDGEAKQQDSSKTIK